MHDADFHRFPDIVAAVINGIHHRFFNGNVRNILDAGGLGAPRMFDEGFAEEVALDVIQRITGHLRQRPLEDLFGELGAARSFLGEPYHINLHGREKPVRLGVEHHQSNVEGKRRFVRSSDDAHLPSQLRQRQACGLFGQIAAHMLKIFLHQITGEIVHFGALVDTVVERHGGGQGKELGFIRSSCPDGTGALSDEIAVLFIIFSQLELRPVRAGLATRRPGNGIRVPSGPADIK